jgi:hypothetical protein
LNPVGQTHLPFENVCPLGQVVWQVDVLELKIVPEGHRWQALLILKKPNDELHSHLKLLVL